MTAIVILLFIGVAVAPSINQSIVKASTEDNLVEVTAQACGIKGYKDTMVKLTREQYQNLEGHLVEFRAKLNQTSTREEAAPIFKEFVIELEKYGLLPKGMNLEKIQRLILRKIYFSQQFFKPTRNNMGLDVKENCNCLIAGKTYNTYYESGLQRFVEKIVEYLPPLRFIAITYVILDLASIILGWINPFALTYRIYLGTVLEDGEIHQPISYDPASGWIETKGSNGTVNYNGTMYGYLPYKKDIGWSFGFYENWAFGGVEGFAGIKLLLPGFSSFYVGSALRVAIGTEPPPELYEKNI